MQSSPLLFNKAHSRAHKTRADLENKSGADFLLRWAEIEILDRLKDIKRDFKETLLLSPLPSDFFTEKLKERTRNLSLQKGLSLSDQETLNIESASHDLIISFFDLHHMNDPVGWLIQLRKALKEDGALIACTIGGETLHQLRQSMMLAEIEVMGGASPRVLPFITKQQMADLMQRAGFSLPVIDSESLTGSYRDIYHLMSDLRAMGETNCLNNRYKFFTPSRVFFEAAKIYAETYSEQDGRISATFEIIFVIGWSPSETQQKPLPRGSGEISLSSILEK